MFSVFCKLLLSSFVFFFCGGDVVFVCVFVCSFVVVAVVVVIVVVPVAVGGNGNVVVGGGEVI